MSEQCRVITVEQWKDYLKLKEQIKEANRLIKMASPLFDYGSANINAESSDFSSYLKKWGVK